jgi:hypothetical protein
MEQDKKHNYIVCVDVNNAEVIESLPKPIVFVSKDDLHHNVRIHCSPGFAQELRLKDGIKRIFPDFAVA